MKKCTVALLLLLAGWLWAGTVVINEVMYDPDGADTGYEWIELFNASDETVELENWIIQKAGTAFSDVFTFPPYLLASGEFLLIGESLVPQAQLTASLAFQNGGSATDGIRLISNNGQYTDTVLYDEPNTNQLPDDIGVVGESFAPDAGSGKTLARKHDGLDTNMAGDDFFVCSQPTPGTTNVYPIDLALGDLLLQLDSNVFHLSTVIYNLSTEYVDNSTASLEIRHLSTLITTLLLPSIPPMDSIIVTHSWPQEASGYYCVSGIVNYANDNNLQNNIAAASILSGRPEVVINEVFCKPLNEGSEWIELFNCGQCAYLVDNFHIEDASGEQILCQGVIYPSDFLLIVEDSTAFLSQFQPPDNVTIFQPPTWTPLNNTVETLTLLDSCDTQFESFTYDASSLDEGVSLERIHPALLPGRDNWCPCLDGATPGAANSVYVAVMPTDVTLAVSPNPFSPSRGEHTILSVTLPQQLSRVTIRIFDLEGRLRQTVADQQVQSATTQLIWDGYDNRGKQLHVGVYVLLMEATALADETVYKKTRTLVIGK